MQPVVQISVQHLQVSYESNCPLWISVECFQSNGTQEIHLCHKSITSAHTGIQILHMEVQPQIPAVCCQAFSFHEMYQSVVVLVWVLEGHPWRKLQSTTAPYDKCFCEHHTTKYHAGMLSDVSCTVLHTFPFVYSLLHRATGIHLCTSKMRCVRMFETACLSVVQSVLANFNEDQKKY